MSLRSRNVPGFRLQLNFNATRAMLKGKALKMQRVKAGVTQAQVAALLGVSQTVLYAVESGKRKVTEREAARILTAIALAAAGESGALVPLSGSDGNSQR